MLVAHRYSHTHTIRLPPPRLYAPDVLFGAPFGEHVLRDAHRCWCLCFGTVSQIEKGGDVQCYGGYHLGLAIGSIIVLLAYIPLICALALTMVER